jgi:hypothetical protein
MTAPGAADTARLLKTQGATCLLVWLVTIAFWINDGTSIIKVISLGLAVFDTAMCGYLFVKFRSLNRSKIGEPTPETSDETLRRLNDSVSDGSES